MLHKLIIANFFKGFGNSLTLILPYHIKNPYSSMPNSLNRDWKIISKDLYKILNSSPKKNVSK